METLRLKIIKSLDDLDQVAREIYYAMTFLEPSHKARPNLNRALEILRAHYPEDVGLSKSVLTRNNYDKT